jgi:hypothetical protein
MRQRARRYLGHDLRESMSETMPRRDGSGEKKMIGMSAHISGKSIHGCQTSAGYPIGYERGHFLWSSHDVYSVSGANAGVMNCPQDQLLEVNAWDAYPIWACDIWQAPHAGEPKSGFRSSCCATMSSLHCGIGTPAHAIPAGIHRVSD